MGFDPLRLPQLGSEAAGGTADHMTSGQLHHKLLVLGLNPPPRYKKAVASWYDACHPQQATEVSSEVSAKTKQSPRRLSSSERAKRGPTARGGHSLQ